MIWAPGAQGIDARVVIAESGDRCHSPDGHRRSSSNAFADEVAGVEAFGERGVEWGEEGAGSARLR